ncbi:hypothetical protein Lfu02_12440 [Longispora fulva]|uniref:Uncharacterized protein n=1 Tax=Longispora fulva TaxID=619741 RepID=A0A8J7GQ72_9ACTN|nr:hypothetical protein [Longispora fulva]MBG6134896.1 hypothetical protein [Longispora fulva]GIG56872.1 hypothetical protein Lfu02_12440 [Longispora fulva]
MRRRTVVTGACAALTVGGLVLAGLWWARPDPRIEYPADAADRPPAVVVVDTTALAMPACPSTGPAAAPAAPGRPGVDKLVEWGAARLVRCAYAPGEQVLDRIDLVDDPAEVTAAVRVLRRMITAEQFAGYFDQDTMVHNLAAFPTFRYLFQFPDGHVTEVDERDGYHRDGLLRLRWSVRGSSVEPLAVPGRRGCGPRQARPCGVSGTSATLPD